MGHMLLAVLMPGTATAGSVDADHVHLGDDFVELIHLVNGGPPLIDTLRRGRAWGYRWLRLSVTKEHYGIRVTRAGPDEA
ncbi:hypothetical protein [Micromonospora sagamiensis]|uniref:Uncharacterized protein n=1 Tax=Micromonospora sagamiensis TaxID=47875 RepID=A0A562WQ53_9ACTN|nr:hypothetical protein [Micromonospora sagamiensis]TWJ32261.1 hypothetical protein JD81_05836 [Micromonospora sagamiensis]BCL14677.1 hypothetical protein GCM10017556_24160 [Micromonospora sagamiensis]